MTKRFVAPLSILVLLFFAGSAVAGVPVSVTVTGELEFSQVSAPPLGDANSGDLVTMSFVVDSDDFMDSPVFPTRGYAIDPWSFSLAFGDSVELGLQDPLPAGVTPYFVIRDNDPAVDGFFVATNVNNPFGFGVPLTQTGIFGQFAASFRVTYGGDTLPSLDILDALGTYDFTGLTVFGWSIDDGPFEAMFIIFTEMTVALVPQDADEDGILDEDDLCADTMMPEGVPTHHLGTNRWALVDEDGIFDTNPPNGNGPGFIFDLQDTGGCSCGQIIEMQGLGNGHVKFGCSNGAMLQWIQQVAGTDYVMSLEQPPPSGSEPIDSVGVPGGGSTHFQSGQESGAPPERNRPYPASRARTDRLK